MQLPRGQFFYLGAGLLPPPIGAGDAQNVTRMVITTTQIRVMGLPRRHIDCQRRFRTLPVIGAARRMVAFD